MGAGVVPVLPRPHRHVSTSPAYQRVCHCFPADRVCPSGKQCPDEERLLRFVIWQLRYSELPKDVQAAAERLSVRYPRDGEDLYLARNRHRHSQLITER